jgi:hypothetical protein
MPNIHRAAAAAGLVLTLAVGAAKAAEPYPAMAPIERYRVASPEAEIALARSAAPPSISNDAEILVLGEKAYDTAVKGRNGFTCIVERSWANEPGNSDFWNPKLRAPICFNPAAARSVLPEYLARTRWVLAGATEPEVARRLKAEVAAGRIGAPEVGSMCYMMSKDGYLGDNVHGPWRPHLMYFLPPIDPAQWGANDVGASAPAFAGSPMMAFAGGIEPVTVFFAPVTTWSDGSPAEPMKM